MTPVIFRGGATSLYLKMLIVTNKYVTQSKYIDKTETKQKQRPTSRVRIKLRDHTLSSDITILVSHGHYC